MGLKESLSDEPEENNPQLNSDLQPPKSCVSSARQEQLLCCLFGGHVDLEYDEMTEVNSRVRIDFRCLDRIVGIAFEDPLQSAN